MTTTCPACGDEVTEKLVPVDGPILLDEDSAPHTCARLPRTWSITFPAGMELLTANNRLSRYPKARIVKTLREQGIVAARQARLPQIKRADIHVTYLPPPRLRRDRHPLASARIEDSENLAPASKALIDGIASAGIFGGGDSRKHVRRVTYELLPGACPRGQMTLHITEVSA